ncbi:MAG: LysM domain-containing protein [Pseudomonadota bacterium]
MLRDLAEIGREINPGKPHVFTQQETKLLGDVVAKLNAPGLGRNERADEARKLIPPYDPKTETPNQNKFGFTLSDERMVKQAEAKWDEHRDRAFKVVRTQAQARGWPKERTDAYLASLKGSREEIALISLAYNNVDAPKAVGAMLDGDPVTMRKEILYRSNGDQTTGHARRRAAEADLATGAPDGWPEQQRSQWNSVEQTPEARTYHATYPGAFARPATPQPANRQAVQGGTTIQPGDTLSKIAARHGVSVEDLAKANGITDPNRIRAGQSLTIPGQFPSPGMIEQRILDGAVKPANGPANQPWPTASHWPKAEPAPEQNASADPRAAAIAEMAKAPLSNPGEAALVKPHQTWTEAEMKDVLGHAQTGFRGWRSGDPMKAVAYERVQDWHTFAYGDDEQRTDGGKPVEPTLKVALPDQPTPARTPQGEDLYQAAGRIGQRVAAAAGLDGMGDAVKGLQRGLNLLGQQPMPARSPAWGPATKPAPLVEDGRYGPKTDFALKHAVSRFGPAKVDDALAMGRFNTFARQAQSTGNVEGLEKKTHAIFGPLFRDSRKEEGAKVEGGVLQETLNQIGGRRYDDWQPLKVDNWIGPKTTAAFGRVLRDEDADSVTSAFGKSLGLL